MQHALWHLIRLRHFLHPIFVSRHSKKQPYQLALLLWVLHSSCSDLPRCVIRLYRAWSGLTHQTLHIRAYKSPVEFPQEVGSILHATLTEATVKQRTYGTHANPFPPILPSSHSHKTDNRDLITEMSKVNVYLWCKYNTSRLRYIQ